MATGEDAPQIVGVIDDRPPELQALDYKNSDKWKVVSNDNGFISSLTIQQMGSDGKYMINNFEENREKKWGEPSRKSKNSSSYKSLETSPKRQNFTLEDSSPRRRMRSPDASSSQKNKRRNRSPDLSPPQRNNRKSPDASPPRHRNRTPDASPPRRGKRSEDSSSPPRKNRFAYAGSPPRRGKKSSDQSPPRRMKRSPDLSPPRRNIRKVSRSPDASPPRRTKISPDSSPPRRKNRKPTRSPDASPTRRLKRSPDSSSPRRPYSCSPDVSPPRRRRKESSPNASTPRRSNNRLPDASPPHKYEKTYLAPQRKDSDRRNLHSKSPPQKHCDFSPPVAVIRKVKLEKSSSFSPERPSTSGKMTKTLDGKAAGLQAATDVRKENSKFREKERKLFEIMSEEMSGKHAGVVRRDRKTGKIRDMRQEAEKQSKKDEKEAARKAIYDRWGAGLKQVEDHRARLDEISHEMSKPLARYANDNDLDEHLKCQERIGDPMLDYIRQKRQEKRKELGIPEMPKYEGQFPDNRFNIRPGYRWDGVDRSNGYEKKWFENINKKKASEEEAYRYSTEDM